METLILIAKDNSQGKKRMFSIWPKEGYDRLGIYAQIVKELFGVNSFNFKYMDFRRETLFDTSETGQYENL